MSDDEEITLQFECGDVEIELSGDRQFVEKMYRRLMDDVEEARRRVRDRAGQVEIPDREVGKRSTIWVYRCGDLMRKIYMVSESELAATPLGEILEIEELSTAYVTREVFSELFADHEDGKTLWAEFTPVGKQKLDEVGGKA